MTLIEYARKLRPLIEKAVISLSDEDALNAITLYPKWSGDGIQYKADDRVQYEGSLYRVLQPHTSQSAWTPIVAVSLFAKVLIPDPGVIPDWEQPGSTNPYMKGDKVRYNNKIWESTIDNNIWAPDVYGWVEVKA